MSLLITLSGDELTTLSGLFIGTDQSGAELSGLSVFESLLGTTFTEIFVGSSLTGATAVFSNNPGISGTITSITDSVVRATITVSLTASIGTTTLGLVVDGVPVTLPFIALPLPAVLPSSTPIFSTSGLFNQYTSGTRTIIERAYGALRIRPQQITGEMIDIALQQLLLVQTSMVNDFAPLWTRQKILVPLIQGQHEYDLGPATIDIGQGGAFYRTMNNVTSSATTQAADAGFTFTFPSPTFVSTMQLSWPTSGFPVTIQSSQDGSTWINAYVSGLYDAQEGNVWLDMKNSNASTYWRVIAQDGVDTFPAGFAAQVYNGPQDIQMARLNKDDYWNMTNKYFQGRPLQFFLDRQLNPVMNLWPSPNLDAQQNCMVIYRTRYIMDPGTMQQTVEFPARWYNAIIYQLASYLALCTPEANPAAVQAVQQQAALELKRAQREERDASPIKFNVNLRRYTR